ncbi:uncharacterized protein LOC128826314 [Malaclemys terrapin pileata]|uniref:uncharacterized protein LOC128826314 n=1 Tax=Malaclemys terrapin pileata TaxID=2991368 RepID=UPI0023A90FF9|nr:uncharacterized protein LOC128826314 [Malaclemys terrapin pileata]
MHLHGSALWCLEELLKFGVRPDAAVPSAPVPDRGISGLGSAGTVPHAEDRPGGLAPPMESPLGLPWLESFRTQDSWVLETIPCLQPQVGRRVLVQGSPRCLVGWVAPPRPPVKLESLKRWNEERVVWCEKGVQILLTTVGAFAAFGLMTIAIGTDYWLYARAFICNTTNISSEEMPHKDKKDPGGLTHSGLWRICCLEGLKRGVCVKINHFPEDTDYDHDSAEYLLLPGAMGHLSQSLCDCSPWHD